VTPSHMQPSSGRAVVVHSDTIASVATTGGKAKMVYTGKAKMICNDVVPALLLVAVKPKSYTLVKTKCDMDS